jgi:CDP-diacylglycerol---glycerol-3-phosphate 3-phosphatidyltransferase
LGGLFDCDVMKLRDGFWDGGFLCDRWVIGWAMAQMQTMMQAAQPDRKVHIPNILTMARIGLAIVFVALLSSVSTPTINPDATVGDRIGELSSGSTTILIISAAIFIIAALTDALDGHLARKWNAITKFGRIMDPFADKILVLGGFVVLAGPNFASPLISGGSMQLSAVAGWMVVAMIARELLVTSIRGVYEGEGVEFPAGAMGKAKMVLQSITIPIILLLIAFGNPGPESGERTIIVILVWATVVVTLLSGLPYIGRALQHTIDENARMLEVMRGKKARKPTKATTTPGAKPRPKSNKGGQGKKRR